MTVFENFVFFFFCLWFVLCLCNRSVAAREWKDRVFSLLNWSVVVYVLAVVTKILWIQQG